ncbi:MAG: endonuclease/exonuclease/phosphatase family protein [Chitinophagales bacterium]|nr:endonuclease/exonuclease/phosphatase family protein [Chitinophagales bacterium]
MTSIRNLSLFIGLLTISFSACKKDNNTLHSDVELHFPFKDTISVLTYNVAGLPEVLSSGNPEKYTAEMGRRISNYSLVGVQEDFNYNHILYQNSTLPYKTQWMGPVPFGDGLNVLSKYKISSLRRVKWAKCNGTDCLTPKGFSYQQIEIADGIKIDVYNLHTNAGIEKKDTDSRRANTLQVFNFIAQHSEGNAVIILGDFNSRYTRLEDTLEVFTRNGFTDTWIEFVRDGILPAKNGQSLMECENTLSPDCETVDRIFYRSNTNIKFRLLDYDKARNAFQENGEDLSDHIPVYSLLEVEVLGKE